MGQSRVAVVGAGIGGLVAALDLAVAGHKVVVLERQPAPGGKMRQVSAGGTLIDAGPTVFTMRWVFESIFSDAGTQLSDHVGLQPAEILARHAWGPDQHLDLYADIDRTADAIGAFAGAREQAGFRAFTQQARQIYDVLDKPFLRAGRPTPLSLVRSAGVRQMLAISPFTTLMSALHTHFADPRLRQLFGRYATYCGSSPYAAPATLMLVAHVERDGVWLVQGGMHRLAAALAALAASHGAVFRYGASVQAINAEAGRASGVTLADGEHIAADAVVLNADAASLAAGCFGDAASRAVPPVPTAQRSLSALTWAMHARSSGFALSRHNVFFSQDYRAEFTDIFRDRRLPRAPTVYVCAQDRGGGDVVDGAERLLCLVNAPANGHETSEEEIERCADRSFGLLERCGLHVDRNAAASVVTGPAQFATMFPATGGALYGQAVHGPWATFRRPGSRTHLPGLYLAGGSTHPGAGVPMAALSGRLAAASVIASLIAPSLIAPSLIAPGLIERGRSTRKSPRAATAGGTSTH